MKNTNNGTGTQGVTSQQRNNATVNGAKSNTVKPEEKVQPVVAEIPDTPRTLDEQIKYFEGLERLVNIRRRFEAHKAAVESLTIEDEDLNKFETGSTYGVRIELHDSSRKEYNITNPKLVIEMQSYLITLLDGKISEYDNKIMTYNG